MGKGKEENGSEKEIGWGRMEVKMVGEHEPDSDRSAVNSCIYCIPWTTHDGVRDGLTPQAAVKVELSRLNWTEKIRRKALLFSGYRYGKFASLQGCRIQIFC